MLFTDKPQDRLAFDRASARVFDDDGHLHVKRTPISKANVCEYLGSEIPGFDELGLDPNRRYKLLRHPDELAKGADTFNGKPLLFDHNPVNADDHDHARTVGSISNPVFEHPYLYADLSCWSGPAIRAIEDGSQKELSSAYRYEPDMQSGVFEGVAYDGVMRDIRANHVALVQKGRAGKDVVVSDSMERLIMANVALSGAAAQTQGALAVYLKPKLAQDARIDLGPIVAGVTAKNFQAQIPGIVLGLMKSTRGKLAADADISDVAEVVEMLAEILPPDQVEEVKEEIEEATTEDDDDVQLRALLKAKGLSDEEIDRICAMTADPAAMDDKDTDKNEDEKGVKAMDSHISSLRAEIAALRRDNAKTLAAAKIAQDKAVEAVRQNLLAVEEARRAVRPWVGDIAMSFDSAEGVVRQALTMLGKSAAGKHPDALMDILEACPKPSDRPAHAPRAVAQDAAAAKSFEERFGTGRIGHAA